MTGIDPLRTTAEEIAARLAAREVSCTEVASRLPRAHRRRSIRDLHAFLHVDPERTLADAARLDASGPTGLQGVPIAYKDLLCTRDVPTTAGSRILEGYRPPYSATVVRRGNDAGLVSLGKLNMDEFAMGSSTENSGVRPDAQSVGPVPRSGRIERRLGRGRRRRARTADARHRHGWLDPPARGPVRRRRAQAHVRRGLALRGDRLRIVARPDRARSDAPCATARCCSR